MSHYDWLDKHIPTIFAELGLNFDHHSGIVGAHGDKCYCYRYDWEEHGIPFEHGVALYLLTYVRPYSETVRETDDGWVDACEWVIEQYPNFRDMLTKLDQ